MVHIQVFGNSNSLPISLVISLSQTLKGLHWDKIPGDNDDEVGARGILYLMIFQQLGQLVRWSWGYHVLLAPKDKYEEYQNETIEEGRYAGDAMGSEETDNLLQSDDEQDSEGHRSSASDTYEPAGRTPVANLSRSSLAELADDGSATPRKQSNGNDKQQHKTSSARPSTADTVMDDADGTQDQSIMSFPRIRNNEEADIPEGIKGVPKRFQIWAKRTKAKTATAVTRKGQAAYAGLPRPLQRTVDFTKAFAAKANNFLWEFMNPPLWAMLAAVIVASVPDLQRLFFEEGSFIKNSVTSAVSSSAGVAVPLILVVLGANLARNTQKRDAEPEEAVIGKKLLVASLLCRMVLPTLIMAPLLAVFAKFVPVSILDDPIFVIVCFLLTGAPSALQLAQICQINGVYENVMSRILFQSYVIWSVLPPPPQLLFFGLSCCRLRCAILLTSIPGSCHPPWCSSCLRWRSLSGPNRTMLFSTGPEPKFFNVSGYFVHLLTQWTRVTVRTRTKEGRQLCERWFLGVLKALALLVLVFWFVHSGGGGVDGYPW